MKEHAFSTLLLYNNYQTISIFQQIQTFLQYLSLCTHAHIKIQLLHNMEQGVTFIQAHKLSLSKFIIEPPINV